MLRAVVGGLGACMLAAGIVLTVLPGHSGLGLLIFGGLVVLSLLFEGRYRSAAASRASTAWQPTGEKFIDPATGRLVEVDYDPQTGERKYRQT